MTKRIEDVLRRAGGDVVPTESSRRLGEVDESIRDRLNVTEGFGREVDSGDAIIGLGKVATKAAKIVKDQYDRASASKLIDKNREEVTAELDKIDKLPPKDQFKELQRLATKISDLEGELDYMAEDTRNNVINAYKNEFKGRMQKKVKSAIAMFTTAAQNKIQEGMDIAANSLTENPNQAIEDVLTSVNTDINNYAENDVQKQIMQDKAISTAYTAIANGYRGREDRKSLRAALESDEFKRNLSKSDYSRLYAYANNEPNGPVSESILNKGFRTTLVNGNLNGIFEAVSQLDDSKPMRKAGGALAHKLANGTGGRSGLISNSDLNSILNTKGLTEVQKAAIRSGVSKVNGFHRNDPNVFRQAHDPDYNKLTEKEWYKKHGIGKATNAEAAQDGMQLVTASSSKIKGASNPFQQQLLSMKRDAGHDPTVYGANLNRALMTAKQQMLKSGVSKKEANALIGVTTLLATYSQDELGYINVAQAQNAAKDPKVIRFTPDREKLDKMLSRTERKLLTDMPDSDAVLTALGVLATDAAIVKLEKDGKPVTDDADAWETVDTYTRIELRSLIKEKLMQGRTALETSKGRYSNGSLVKNKQGAALSFPKAMLESDSNISNRNKWSRLIQPYALKSLASGSEIFDETTKTRLQEGSIETYIEHIRGGLGVRLMIRNIDPSTGKHLSPGPARRRDGSIVEWSYGDITSGNIGLTPKAK